MRLFDGTGDAGVVEGDSRPRAPRAGSRRLRDISHLYISQPRPLPGVAPPPRRALRAAVIGRGFPAAECAASLALQWARMGRRVLVLDLERSLPNIGLRLGLAPGAYLAPWLGVPARIERGALGVRVLTLPEVAAADTLVAAAVRDADVVVLRLQGGEPHATLAPFAAALALPPVATTMERAAARSPMFEAWMATARRPPRPVRAPSAHLDRSERMDRIEDWLDVAIPIGDAIGMTAFGAVPVRPLGWGDASAPEGWARVPAHEPPAALPLALLEPEHAVTRVFESLAQALLAGLGGRRGGDRVA